MNETRILIRLLYMYIPRKSAQLCQNLGISRGGGVWTPQTPLGTPLVHGTGRSVLVGQGLKYTKQNAQFTKPNCRNSEHFRCSVYMMKKSFKNTTSKLWSAVNWTMRHFYLQSIYAKSTNAVARNFFLSWVRSSSTEVLIGHCSLEVREGTIITFR
jgi:hypothetical protein